MSRTFRNHQKSVYLLIVLLWAIGAAALSGCRQSAPPAPFEPLPLRGQVRLNSSKPYQEVRVPFTFEGSRIIVTPILAGRPVRCILDTSSFCALLWPDDLQLPGKTIGRTESFMLWPGAPLVQADWIRLASLKLGDFTLTQSPTMAYPADKIYQHYPSTNKPGKPLPRLLPILGCAAFDQVVLTIDFQKRQLIFRNHSYDITKLPPAPGRDLFRMAAPLIAQPKGVQPILVSGTVSGQPVRFLVDTGARCISVALTDPALIAKISRRANQKAVYSSFSAPSTLPDPTSTLGRIVNNSAVTLMPTSNQVGNALLGPVALQSCRVTLDLSRRMMMLETNTDGNKQARLEGYKKYAKAHPHSYGVHIYLAKLLDQVGDYPTALAEFRKSIALEPSNEGGYYSYGRTLLDMGKATQAAAQFRRAVAIAPRTSVFHLWLGTAYAWQHQRSLASQEWKRAMSLDQTGDVTQQARQMFGNYPIKS